MALSFVSVQSFTAHLQIIKTARDFRAVFYCIKQIVLALARLHLVAAERFLRFSIRCMLARFWIVFAQL